MAPFHAGPPATSILKWAVRVKSSAGLAFLVLASTLAATVPGRAAESTQSVLTFHAEPTRAGNYVLPDLTWGRARSLRPDPSFHPKIPDHIYAQPLYWRESPQRALVLVATEDDNVYALDATTGATVWKTSLGKAVPRSAMPCGDINPIGVTGAPVINPVTQAVYLGALVANPASGAPQQEIFALSLKTGAVLPGWPVDVSKALAAQGVAFNSRTQNQRGALAVLDGVVYIPYGSMWDCGEYRGLVVGVKLSDPKSVTNWHTASFGGGIWSPGGIATDGSSLFVATGTEHNPTSSDDSVGAAYSGAKWGDGQAVIRLNPGPSFSGKTKDFFAPSDWRQHDANDLDISGSAPVLFDLDGEKLEIQLSKDTNAYLLNRENLGGFGGSLAKTQVATTAMITTPAVYTEGDRAMVAFQGPGKDCPSTQGKGQPELTMLQITAGSAPSIKTAWCAALSGNTPHTQLGAAMVTTTDGHANPIVWIYGAEDDNRLYAFEGDTGRRLFVSAPMPGLHRFQSLIAIGHRLYVAADGNVFAFEF